MKYLAFFFVVLFEQMSLAQTDEMVCLEKITKDLDSFFVAEMGNSEYSTIRDSVKIWFEVRVDSTGSLSHSRLRHFQGVEEKYGIQLIGFLDSLKYQCLYKVYEFGRVAQDLKINISFIPSGYSYYGP